MIIYKGIEIEEINGEYQTTAFNIGRYSSLKRIKHIIKYILSINK